MLQTHFLRLFFSHRMNVLFLFFFIRVLAVVAGCLGCGECPPPEKAAALASAGRNAGCCVLLGCDPEKRDERSPSYGMLNGAFFGRSSCSDGGLHVLSSVQRLHHDSCRAIFGMDGREFVGTAACSCSINGLNHGEHLPHDIRRPSSS